MGEAARERYLKLFAPEAVLSMLLSTYSNVTGNGHDINGASLNGRHPWAVETKNHAVAMACHQRS